MQTAPNRPDISVVILTLNEGDNIGPLLTAISGVLSRLNLRHEMIIVDGGSADKTVENARAAGALCIEQRRPGFGGALREGIEAAKGRYILTLDADWSHPPELIPTLWEARTHADIVIASRYVDGGQSDASIWRRSLSVFLNYFFAAALSLPRGDMSSGFRLYRRDILTPREYMAENFDILEEVLVRAVANGHSVHEVPLKYQNRLHGTSHASCIKFAKSFIPTLCRMWVLRNSLQAADYDHRAYNSMIPPQRMWQHARRKIIWNYLPKEGVVLDIGCGSNRLVQDLGDRAVALDLSLPKLRFLKRTNPLRVRASTFALPVRDASVDSIVHSEVLEHVPFDEKLFDEVARVLKPRGTLVIGTPDYGRRWWRFIELVYRTILPNAYTDEHVSHYNRHMLIDLLAEHGFRVRSYKYVYGGEVIIKAEKAAA